MNKIKITLSFIKNLIKRELDYLSITPTSALLIITYRCTSHCKMCTIWKRGEITDAKKELSLDDWKKCVDMIYSKNLKFIEIFGGDALLRKDVTIPLIEYIKKKNEEIVIEFPTNCNLLDKETVIALVKAGLDKIYISLDGPLEIHDKMRGSPGTYNNVQKALEYFVEVKKNFKSQKPKIVINCTISSNNVDNFDNIINSVKKLGLDDVEFDLEYVGEFKEKNIQNTVLDGIKPTPFYITQGHSNLLSIEQAILLKKKMKNIRELSKKLKIKISTYVIDSLAIDDLINGTISNKKCYMSRSLVSIDPFGNVMGCFHYNNYIFGNIKYSNFSFIWRNNKHLNFLKSRKAGKIKICKNCVSGVKRNATFMQSLYRYAYFILRRKGFDE